VVSFAIHVVKFLYHYKFSYNIKTSKTICFSNYVFVYIIIIIWLFSLGCATRFSYMLALSVPDEDCIRLKLVFPRIKLELPTLKLVLPGIKLVETTVRAYTCSTTRTHYPDYDSSGLCFFFLMLCAYRRGSKSQL
jgi:hypothetical protein